MLAAESQVIELTRDRVQLRLGVQSLVTEQNRRFLEERLSAYFGRPFRVLFEAGATELARRWLMPIAVGVPRSIRKWLSASRTIRLSKRFCGFSAARLTRVQFDRSVKKKSAEPSKSGKEQQHFFKTLNGGSHARHGWNGRHGAV